MAREIRLKHRFPEDCFKPAGRMGAFTCAGGRDIAVMPIPGGDFDKPQFPDIPRYGGLRHLKAAPAQMREKFFLFINRMLADQLQNFAVACVFHCVTVLSAFCLWLQTDPPR